MYGYRIKNVFKYYDKNSLSISASDGLCLLLRACRGMVVSKFCPGTGRSIRVVGENRTLCQTTKKIIIKRKRKHH